MADQLKIKAQITQFPCLVTNDDEEPSYSYSDVKGNKLKLQLIPKDKANYIALKIENLTQLKWKRNEAIEIRKDLSSPLLS